MFLKEPKIKYSLYSLRRLIPFWVSQVSGAHLGALCARAHTSRLQRWRVVGNKHVGDLIGSRFDPHISRTRGERLTICAIWPIFL